MITAYTYQDQQLKIIELTIEDGLPEQTLWLDLYKPDDDERDWLSRYSVEEVPDEEDINEIEPRHVSIKTKTACISTLCFRSGLARMFVASTSHSTCVAVFWSPYVKRMSVLFVCCVTICASDALWWPRLKRCLSSSLILR